MARWKKRFLLLFLFLLFFLVPLLLPGGSTSNPKAFAGGGRVDKGSPSFVTNGEAPVIRFDGEEMYAYFQTTDKLLTVDGTDEISMPKLLEGEEISITFPVSSPDKQNSATASEEGRINLTLTADPIYWRFVTDKDDIGVGNFTVNLEALKELLPQELKGFTTEYRISGTEKELKESLRIKHADNESDSTGYIAGDGLTLNQLPEEFSRIGRDKSKGELIGRLKLAANYAFKVPPNEYSAAVQGKLTLVIWKNIYKN
ncbi:hypothetical protein [Anaerocolumna chitinilytica]|uniref:Uncharacterized protein n=1 Tax=Anaerocolumna chitinilytica TaxID=1727145 RepID=A0A7I8DLW9_9FIRM|nr:hypothetical protein [Anaerocolumna chitinilytica]BCJ97276.1 hypothetical protein bsdcttw_03170 [Anaerocolumna chitinilytica]